MNKVETKINIRIDKRTKQDAKKTLEALGLDISSGIKLFLKNVINSQSIPFEIKTKNGFTLDQEQKILKETQDTLVGIKSKKIKPFDSVDEFFKSLV